MAFAVGDVVSMRLSDKIGTNGLLGPQIQAQPPVFGVVTDDVDQSALGLLWQDGRLDTGVPGVSLDLIGAASGPVVTALQGKVVQAASESPEYQGPVVMFYTRDGAAAGSPTASLALVRSEVGTYREVLASDLTAVTGR